MARPLLIFSLLVLLAGCTPAPPPWPAADLRDPSCTALYRQMDRAIARNEAENAAGTPVEGFPYLRVNRFLADLAPRLRQPADGDLWLHQATRLDIELRLLEYRNLPSEDPFRSRWDHEGILQDHLELCAALLAGTDRDQPDFWDRVVERSRVPDDYVTLYRFPLYPLAALPVSVLTESARDQFRGWFATPWENQNTEGTLVRYAPDYRPPLSPDQVRQIMHRSANNSLRWPIPGKDDAHLLLAALAPILYIDETAAYDRLVQPRWQEERLDFNPEQPRVYTYLSHTWWQGIPLLQLNYAFWFIAREGENAPWIERGTLDGLTVRITLDQDGRIFLLDLMNNCGCYHAAFPSSRLVPKEREASLKPDLFIPCTLPEPPTAGPIGLRINSGWHQVQQITTRNPDAAAKRPYVLRPYADLEALPTATGHRSLFRPDGVARGSERIEPLLLFSMGVPDVGSMRQRANHPISLIGRDHFDDPDLLERYFEPASAAP